MSSAIKPTDPPDSSKRATLLTDELGDEAAAKLTDKKSCLDRLKYHLEVLQTHPYIFLVSLLVFSALCASGLLIISFFAKQEENELRDEAFDLAIETGNFFSGQLDRAILPVFSMAQFVSEIDIFGDIPDQIGTLGEPGARPLLSFDAERSTGHRFRNVTGTCDDPELVDRFNRIAATIKKNANMEGILLSLELAPEAVVCVVYPLKNSEDFPDGIVVDNSGAIGLDLLASSGNSLSALQSIENSEITVVGPFPIEYCQGADCSPETLVEQAFYARLPIRASAREKVVDGVAYNFWGFATGGINWNALIKQSNIHEKFTELGLGFQLTKNDILEDLETGAVTKQAVILAETPGFDSRNSDTVTTALETTASEWQMTISYVQDDDWMVWEITATVIVSFILSLLIYTILVQKQNYKSIEKKYLEDLAQPQKLRLRLFLEEGARNASVVNIEDLIHNRKPIADLYSNTTVLFCDISGFTAWSSEREPAQVFTLLQVIFHSFDKIASSVGVFNVETIGDCYVAITGFPEAQADHAVRMVDFAQQCLTKAKELTKRLEMTLGPDTEDLGFRFSLHSGPVTAGVLVSERSRFQLFGETVKVASRLESTAQRNRIQISQATADFLIQAGKGKCIKPLEEQATIKGMGTFQTYWFVPPRKLKQQRSLLSAGISSAAEVASSLDVHTEETKSQTGGDDSERPSTLWGGDDDDDLSEADMAAEKDKAQRLIEWHVDSMSRLLKMIVARKGKNKKSSSITKTFANLASAHAGDTLLDEIVEVIQLPKLDEKSKRIVHPESITLAPEVTSQLRDYVTEIAALYRPNHFHNFEHASHVTMSVHKLLNRIVTPDSIDCNRDNVKAVMNDLHNYTFGITSDPLTHFAVVFCALVHDVDHTGVSNAQRGKEEPKLAEHYMSKSLAEQNSVDLSWEVLMKPKYKDLHSCLFSNEKDLMRFRQIVVNIVLATDIFDKEFKELRNLRWNKAFHPDQFDASTGSVSSTSPSSLDLSSSDQAEPMEGTRGYATNRKATIVIEHIMQASDVAHTMQHWHIYQKWNERLFNEMSEAYKMGRSPSDPSQGWYKGELWFFDNYVIPLATKLEECGVFGVASDECLFNALNNRKEWACRGEKTVEEMVERRRKSEEGSS